MIKHPYNPLPISRIRSDAKRRNRRNFLRRCRRHFPGLLLENNREGANESTVPFSRRLPSSLLCYKLPIENQTNNARRIKDFRIDVTLPARLPTRFVNWVGKVGVYPSLVEKGESRRK